MSGFGLRAVLAYVVFLGAFLAPTASASGSMAVMMPGKPLAAGSNFPAQPNGKFTLSVEDMRIKVPGGFVRWTREYNGNKWVFNPNWQGLKFEYEVLDYYGGQSYVPTGDTGGSAGLMLSRPPARPPETFGGYSLPGGSSQIPADALPEFASLDATGYIYGDVAWIGRNGVWFQANSDKSAYTQYGSGSSRYTMTVTRDASGFVTNYRWTDRKGDWIDHDRYGAVTAYGDKNDVKVTMEYTVTRGAPRRITWGLTNASIESDDVTERLKRVRDNNGNVVLEIVNVDGGFEVQDVSGVKDGLPVRKVRYKTGPGGIEKVTDLRGYDTTYGYDSKNRLTSITDAEERVHKIEYRADNRMLKETNAAGGVTDYVYDYDKVKKLFFVRITYPETAAGRQTEERWYDQDGYMLSVDVNGQSWVQFAKDGRSAKQTNGRGHATTVTRDEFNQVLKIEYPDGTTSSRTYEPAHLNLVTQTDEAGVASRLEYDPKGNLVKATAAVGTADARVTEYVVNDLGQVSQITRKGRVELDGRVTPDAVWDLEYDERGNVRRLTDPERNVREFVYDAGGRLREYKDARGHTTYYEVDGAGNLIRVTDSLNRIWRYEYDKVGNLLTVTDARSKAFHTAYNALNHAKLYTDALGGEYAIKYNGEGLPVKETDEDGRLYQREFDAFLRLTKEVDGLGNVVKFGYAATDGGDGYFERPTTIEYPTYSVQLTYDERDRETGQVVLNPRGDGLVGLTSSTAYDKGGRVLSESDAYGKSRFYGYNALGQLASVIDTLGNKTELKYDARGNLTQVRDPNNHIYRYEHDRNDRVVKTILPLSQATTFRYDENGNLFERVDAKGNKAVVTYDDANRPIEVKQHSPDGTLVRVSTLTWDDADRLSGWTDTDLTRPAGQQTTSSVQTRDDNGRLTSETVTYPNPAGGTVSYTYGYGYSLAGKKTRLTWPDGTDITYGYSTHGELESITLPGEGTISVNAYKWMAAQKVTFPGGTVQERTYDGLLDLESLTVKAPSQQVALSVQNTWGNVQELKSSWRTDVLPSGTFAQDSSYTYDDEVRLRTATTDTGGLLGTHTQSYTLDAVANRVEHSEVAGAWTYDENNRLLQRGVGTDATSYEYDANGNLTRKSEGATGQVTNYIYDTQDRLVEVRDGANGLIARYGYGISNTRLWKEQYRDRGGELLAQAQRSYFIYADEGLIAEAVQNIAVEPDGAVSAAEPPVLMAQYGPRPDSQFTTGMLFVKTKNGSGNDVVAFFQNNELGAPIQAVDKNGVVVWGATYEPFGRASLTAGTGDMAIVNNLRYAGQYYDEETGLHYNFNRYYDTETGRYITVDPLGLVAGLNVYTYVGGNPILGVDPYGLFDLTDAASWPSIPQGGVDAAAGFGDTLSFGLTNAVRNGLGTNGSVNKCSGEYRGGQMAGMGLSVAFGGAHLGRNAMNLGMKKMFGNRAYSTVQKTWRDSVGGYKGKYELHHWFSPQSAGGANAGWNLVPVSPGLNRLMSDGMSGPVSWLAYNAFRTSMISMYLVAPVGAASGAGGGGGDCGC